LDPARSVVYHLITIVQAIRLVNFFFAGENPWRRFLSIRLRSGKSISIIYHSIT